MKTLFNCIIFIFIYNIVYPALALSQTNTQASGGVSTPKKDAQPSLSIRSASLEHKIKSAERKIQAREKEAQKKIEAMLKASQQKLAYYNEGKRYYAAKRYKDAIDYFEKVVDMDPGYEPAKLYLENAILQQNIVSEQATIDEIKLKMADIIAEFDRKRQTLGSLAAEYLIEQAQKKCQLGDFKGAENIYNLCYKVYPHSRDKIDWFVRATYDLNTLYKEMEEHVRNIGELSIVE